MNDWTAKYTLTASNEDEARRFITAQAIRDVPNASVEFVKGPTRDKGPRSYWRATVRRVRQTGDND